MGNIVLLSGEPRVGKTTALKKIIQMVGEHNCIGFYTEEVRDEFDRVGFDCVNLDGRRLRIADVNLHSDVRMGRYGIDIEAFEEFALKSLSIANTSKFFIIDEIGPIQFLSSKFKLHINNILTGQYFIIGTIFYNTHPDIDKIKNTPGIKIYTMTRENNDTILKSVFHEIQRLIDGR